MSYLRASEARDLVAGRWRQLWLRKTGREPAEDLTWKQPVQVGRAVESTILAFTIHDLVEGGMKGWHPEEPAADVIDEQGPRWEHGQWSMHFDACLHLGGQYIPIEAKYTDNDSPVDELVGRYFAQCQVYCQGLNAPGTILSVFYGGTRHTVYWLWRDREWITAVKAATETFLQFVDLDIEPVDIPPIADHLPPPRWIPGAKRTAAVLNQLGAHHA